MGQYFILISLFSVGLLCGCSGQFVPPAAFPGCPTDLTCHTSTAVVNMFDFDRSALNADLVLDDGPAAPIRGMDYPGSPSAYHFSMQNASSVSLFPPPTWSSGHLPRDGNMSCTGTPLPRWNLQWTSPSSDNFDSWHSAYEATSQSINITSNQRNYWCSIILYATSVGGGNAELTATYDDNTTDTSSVLTIPDWVESSCSGNCAVGTPSLYRCFPFDPYVWTPGFYIFGFQFNVNPSKLLKSISWVAPGRVAIFSIMGVVANPPSTQPPISQPQSAEPPTASAAPSTAPASLSPKSSPEQPPVAVPSLQPSIPRLTCPPPAPTPQFVCFETLGIWYAPSLIIDSPSTNSTRPVIALNGNSAVVQGNASIPSATLQIQVNGTLIVQGCADIEGVSIQINTTPQEIKKSPEIVPVVSESLCLVGAVSEITITNIDSQTVNCAKISSTSTRNSRSLSVVIILDDSGCNAPSGQVSGLSVPAVAGIAVGVAVIVIVILVTIIALTRNRQWGLFGIKDRLSKNRKDEDDPGTMSERTQEELPKVTPIESDVESESDELPPPDEGDPVEILLSDLDKKLLIKHSDLTFLSKLGQGAYGVVFKGRWRKTRVAIKQTTTLSIDREALQSFVKESKLMIDLPPHPNVVQVLGVCVQESNVFVVMELCAHGSLSSLLERADPPSIDERLSYIASFSHGVLHLHENSIVHRDLAARNILIGAGGVSKISEYVKKHRYAGFEPLLIHSISSFGMARMIDNFERQGTTHSTIGPIRWMAPEAMKRIYSTMSDVWSWANTVVEILTGKDPFPGMELLEVATRVQAEGMHPVIPENTPPWLTDLLIRCWNLNPRERPTMADIVDIMDANVE